MVKIKGRSPINSNFTYALPLSPRLKAATLSNGGRTVDFDRK
ncbi:hypothetical protein [Synechocystis sp. PCC 7509]|nr:hypothetical protein [Synechocystis sp. PCC 7509]